MAIHPLGDSALIADYSPLFALVTNGVTDVVAAFGMTAFYFDPSKTDAETVREWIGCQAGDAQKAPQSRSIELPVLYGDETDSDLNAIATHGGLSPSETIRRHAAAEYTVGAIGFQPGFPYLEGLPPELHTPRQASPRVRVPAGSVGIGGPYTGVYPQESPGGWNLIGRTPLRLFDEHRAESRGGPSLLRTGDRVRFRAIDAAEFERLAAENQPTPPRLDPPPDRPLFRVLSPGVQTTIQDLGRPGRQHLGISPGGAMDSTSLRLANLLVGNHENTPAIEATLVGPVLECLTPVTIGVSGAVPAAAPRRLTPGEQLDLRQMTDGARTYVALPGGVVGPIGEPLAAGDPIGSRDDQAVERLGVRSIGRWSVPARQPISRETPTTIRVLRGPQADRFEESVWTRFLAEPYRITPQSSRMGLRCEGSTIEANDASALPSQPVCHGTIQVPPNGQPIILGADRQTLGGYPIIAAVASVDWPLLGQLRPGDPIRFVEIDLLTAQAARRDAERNLSLTATGIQLQKKEANHQDTKDTKR